MDLYLVRHGLSVHNMDPEEAAKLPVNPLFEGVDEEDCPLSPQGLMQADLTGIRLQDIPFDAALVSPLLRTIQTATGILKHQKRQLTMEIMPFLSECYTAPDFRMVSERVHGQIWPDIKLIQPYDNMEKIEYSYNWNRAGEVKDYIRARFQGNENVLVVSHGGFLNGYVIAQLLDLPPQDPVWTRVFGAENCGITLLRFHADGTMEVVVMDDTGHLGEQVSRDSLLSYP